VNACGCAAMATSFGCVRGSQHTTPRSSTRLIITTVIGISGIHRDGGEGGGTVGIAACASTSARTRCSCPEGRPMTPMTGSSASIRRIVMSDRDRVSPTRPRTDIGTSTRRLMIAMLGGLIDVERNLIRTRTPEGRSRAQQRRRRMGHPPKLTIVLQPIPAQIPPISLPFPPYTTLHPPQCRPRRDY